MLKMEEDEESNPPLMGTYKHLLDDHPQHRLVVEDVTDDDDDELLPVIDLLQDAEQCRAAMVRAASEWGFFQVTNHGVPQQLLDELHEAQVAVFRRPFECKVREPLLGFSPESYRWGTPTATCLEQLSWSEAYHIPMATISSTQPAATGDDTKTRLVIEEVASAVSKLALQLAGILVAGLDEEEDEVVAGCTRSTCFLRLNRYPVAAASGRLLLLFGLCPYTDSDFLTIVHQQQQDGVGGLQLRKDDGRWVAVRPNPGALIVNVGDLLQAFTNDRYRSVQHRVVVPTAATDRFSVAFFLCPADDTLIRPRCGSGDPPRYRSFTFAEYRNQIKDDVSRTGRKIGLQRFRLPGQLRPIVTSQKPTTGECIL
ncbi:unnamed protein product [Urochloa humidicola]